MMLNKTHLNASESQLTWENQIKPLGFQPTPQPHITASFQSSPANTWQRGRAHITCMKVRIISLSPHSRNSRTIWCLFWSAQPGCRREYLSMVTWTVVCILQVQILQTWVFCRTKGKQKPESETSVPYKRIHFININSFSLASPQK